jgi:prepilin peptidase CpaA
MANDLMAPSAPTQTPATPDDLGIDREFVFQMARMPLLALVWLAAGVAAHYAWAAVAPDDAVNYGPLVVVCVGMLLAAFIDGWALKVPNWVTLPLVLSGWMLGLLHDTGFAAGGTGGFTSAFWGTVAGFALLFPILAIGGVGQGDVKMQMGFGSWVGAYFGTAGPTDLHWFGVVFWAFAFGAIAGGVFGLAMILMRRDFRKNAAMVSAIGKDVQLFLTGHQMEATTRATERRKQWVKLPYGIPLCVGFLGYLWYALFLVG